MNDYENLKNGEMDRVGFIAKMKFFTGGTPNEERYVEELNWHYAVYELFQKLV